MMPKSLKNNLSEILGKIPIVSMILFFLGSFGIVFLLYMSLVYWRVNWYSIPDYSLSFLIRTLIIALSVSCIAISLRTDHLKDHFAISKTQTVAVAVATLLTVMSFILCIVFPETANLLGEEDHLIEWLSFILLFAALAMILVLFYKKMLPVKDHTLLYTSLLIFALALFVMGMEEISWGQRIVGVKTPGLFRENSQNEINIHNFKTTEIDTAYYTGIFLLCVFLPYIKLCFPNVFSKKYFEIMIPGPYMILVGALPFAFHYNKWNLLFTQFWFFGVISIALIIAFSQRKYKTRSLFSMLLLAVCFMQLLFLMAGSSNPVLVTGRIAEYKELISQWALLVYSGSVYHKVRTYAGSEANCSRTE